MNPALYLGASEITGRLQPARDQVSWRPVLTRGENVKIFLLATAQVLTVLGFITYLAFPSHLPLLAHHGPVYRVAAIVGWLAIVGLQVIQLLQTLSLLHFASRARDPIPMEYRDGIRAAVLTTIVPSKEPFEGVERTLRAMRKLRHSGPVDVWLLDEGGDPVIKAKCEALGVHHFSRRGVPAWNTESGEFRTKTKHGNHNAWRAAYEHNYDVVAQMDPDHAPLDTHDFLERTVGYFNDPDIAFVVAPQVYGNLEANFVARGSAELAYLFHGTVQRGCNGLGAAVLIGTNHVYRPAAWKQIGGYQDCIIEDHLTAMVAPSAVNAATGHHWKGLYTPDILSVGEGPTTWTDFFSQQKRWAYGIFEIARRKSPKVLPKLTRHQRWSFASLQFFYPSVSAIWLFGNLLSALYLLGGVSSSRLYAGTWVIFFSLSTLLGAGTCFWLRRFNLMPHERKSWALAGVALNLFTTPVYLAAGISQLLRRPLAYQVTAKGRLVSGDTWRTFRLQIGWAAFAGGCILTGAVTGRHYPSLYVWMSITLLLSLAPVAMWGTTWFEQYRRAAVAAAEEIVDHSRLDLQGQDAG